MPLLVDADHFSKGVWASEGPLRLVTHTCLTCGMRLKTFESFREHRAAAICRPLEEHGAALQPGWQHGVMPQEDRDALASLLAQMPDPEPIDTAQWLEETLPAPPSATIELAD